MTYKQVRPIEHLQRYATAALWAVLLSLAAGVAVISKQVFLGPESEVVQAQVQRPGMPGAQWLRSPAIHCAIELAFAACVIGLGSWLLTRKLSRGWTWLFGWRKPAGRDGLFLMPAVLVGSVAGGCVDAAAVGVGASGRWLH